MTAVLVRVLLVPSRVSAQWREAIADACADKGWDYNDYWGGAAPILTAGKNTVIVGWNGEIPELPTSFWVVLTCPPAEAVLALAEQLSLSRLDAVHHCSARFALCSDLVQQGGAVASQYDLEIDFPVLGLVRLPMVYLPASDSGSFELGLYDAIPPKTDTRFAWSPRLLTYHTEVNFDQDLARVEVIGRRRLLFNGPNIVLPKGFWELRVELIANPQNVLNLLLEWGHGTIVSALDHVFTRPGRYELTFVHEWLEAAPADFRASLMIPVLEGSREVQSLSLKRIS